MEPAIETRVTKLEEVLAEFVTYTTATIQEIRDEVKEFKDEMLAFKNEMKAFKDEMLEFKNEMKAFKDEMLEFKNEMKAFKDEILVFKTGVEEYKERSELSMEKFKEEMLAFKKGVEEYKERSELSMEKFKEEMLEFKNEMKAFKDEILVFKTGVEEYKERSELSMEKFKEEMLAFRKGIEEYKERSELEMKKFKEELNRKWGELARKMGTIVEDIIAPGAPDAIYRKFGVEILDLMVRRKVKDKNRNTEEFDLIMIGEDDKVYLVEVKSTPTVEAVLGVINKVTRLKEILYPDREIVPIFGSLYVSDDIVNFATKNSIYVLGMKGEYLEVLN